MATFTQTQINEMAKQLHDFKWVTSWLEAIATRITLYEGEVVWLGCPKTGRLYVSSNFEDLFTNMEADGVDLRTAAVKRLDG